jgi:hypothetical protein
MNKCELAFSRDGGETWEVVGVTDFTIEDLGPPSEDSGEVIIVGGGGPFSISGELRATFDCTPSPPFAYLFGHREPKPDRSKPWLRPKKGRGRQL